MASSKLEMSLDDIIKQTKKTERSQMRVGGSIRRKSTTKKGSIILASNKNKRVGRQRLSGAGKNNQSKSKPVVSQRRKTLGGMINKQRRNGVGLKNKALTTVATMNLVKKLVKKALTQTNTLRPVRGVRSKFNRSRIGNARILGRSPLNRVNQRSRQIGRRQRIVAPVPMAAIQMSTKTRARGPIHYVPVIETIPAVRRIRYVPQRVANTNFGGKLVRNNRGPKRRIPQQQQRFSTIREQINALRQGAARTQNRQQVIMVKQQPRVRMIPAQQNRQRKPQLGQQQQLLRQRKQPQQVLVDPFYEPPNYLQRIPTQVIGNGNRRFTGKF